MNQIDLKDFALSSRKIPNYLLKHRPKTKKVVSTFSLLIGYMIDFYAVVTASFIMSGIFQASVQNFVLTKKLTHVSQTMTELPMMILPISLLSYFFFSFFFNEGQTLGMKIVGSRISMSQKDFGASFKWALYSSAIVLTCGLIYPFTKNWLLANSLGKFETHDHFYQTLVEERESYLVDLTKMAQDYTNEKSAIEEEENYSIAA